MDPITNIELQLKEALLTIQSSTTLPGGYTYYNDVSVVNIDDECIAVERGDYPTFSIYLNPDEKVLSGRQRAYENELNIKLVGSVTLDNDMDIDAPRFEINKKLSELWTDLKALFSFNYNLNCSCDINEIISMRRVYSNNNDQFRVGDIEVVLRIKYNQSRINPNLKCNL